MFKTFDFKFNMKNVNDYMGPVTFWDLEGNAPLIFEQVDIDLDTIRKMLGVPDLSTPYLYFQSGDSTLLAMKDLDMEPVTVPQTTIVYVKPVVDTNAITPEEHRQMCRYGLLLETRDGKYILHPMPSLFRSIPPEKLLEAFFNPEDDLLTAYLNMAKCFHLDDRNELVYECEDRFKTLQSYLSKMDNPKYSRRADSLVEAMWGKELELTDIQFNVEKRVSMWTL